ncbi:MAG: hypothetical protein HOB14_11320 [Gammaproteobacteria bacterium]|nr:hypothetical protein [Gammaproteobacteria bacterium]MBT6702242.1 hypothetical protein [Gammaproteobacteria bacterium]
MSTDSQVVIEEIIRQELIRYVTKVDPCGCYTDECSRDNYQNIMTLEDAIISLVEAIFTYEHWMTANGYL